MTTEAVVTDQTKLGQARADVDDALAVLNGMRDLPRSIGTEMVRESLASASAIIGDVINTQKTYLANEDQITVAQIAVALTAAAESLGEMWREGAYGNLPRTVLGLQHYAKRLTKIALP